VCVRRSPGFPFSSIRRSARASGFSGEASTPGKAAGLSRTQWSLRVSIQKLLVPDRAAGAVPRRSLRAHGWHKRGATPRHRGQRYGWPIRSGARRTEGSLRARRAPQVRHGWRASRVKGLCEIAARAPAASGDGGGHRLRREPRRPEFDRQMATGSERPSPGWRRPAPSGCPHTIRAANATGCRAPRQSARTFGSGRARPSLRSGISRGVENAHGGTNR